MNLKRHILIAGRNKTGLGALRKSLERNIEEEIGVRVITNGHSDPLYGLKDPPDLLIFDLSEQWREELEALGNRGASHRCPMIAVGPHDDPDAMRSAMRVGAREFLSNPVVADDLSKAVRTVLNELQENERSGRTQLIAVINAKGGAGASFVACNLAELIAERLGKHTCLLDLDLQFSAQPLYLDVDPSNGLVEALSHVRQMDVVALRGYMAHHASGLDLIAPLADELTLPWEVPEEHLRELLDLLSGDYEVIVVDLPRQIDSLSALICERADNVLLVMQQGLADVRDATRLAEIMQGELGVSREKLNLIINRYNSRGALDNGDIEEAVRIDKSYNIPSDFVRVARSMNTGVPLAQAEPNAAITKSILRLARSLVDSRVGVHAGFLRTAFGNLFSRLEGAS